MLALSIRVSVGQATRKFVGLCAVPSTSFVQSAGITSPGGKPWVRERKPFDYRRKVFTMLHQPFDRTLARMDENSKVIVVDGPIASGKTEFAKKLAHQLDFKFVPQPDTRELYDCGDSGLSYLDLDELLPREYQVYTLDSFLTDKTPTLSEGRCRAGQLQMDYFLARLYTYNDALLHMLSTGQGVVCVRSIWSDRVFAKALYENDLLSKKGWEYYTDEIAISHTIDYPRPHLIIYLDADVEETKANIKRRNRGAEVDSKVLTDDFLASIEEDYKDTVLPSLENHSELLVYPFVPDITDHEIALMVEDIEALGPMNHSGISDDHFLDDWKYPRDEEFAWKRKEYQNLTLADTFFGHARPWHAPDMLKDMYYDFERQELYMNTPGWEFETRFDSSLQPWWKIALNIPLMQKPKERRKFWIPA